MSKTELSRFKAKAKEKVDFSVWSFENVERVDE